MGVIERAIDSIVGALNPRQAIVRAQNRAALEVIERHQKRRGYEAAGTGRRTDGWNAFYQAPWAEVGRDLPRLRSRSIDLYNNNPWAKKAVTAIANNTIGNGILPSLPKGRIAKLWKEWAETIDCDFDGLHTFAGLQWLVMHTIAMSGEAIIVRRRSNQRMGLQLQVLEGAYLDNSRQLGMANTDQNYTVDGVEFDSSGRRTAYWIYDTHPYYGNATSKKIPAEDVIHLYDVLRPGQVRGVPFGVAAMLRLRDFDEYEDAQLMRQKVAACYAAFVYDAGENTAIGAKADLLPKEVQPGGVHRMPPGTRVEFGNPPAADGYSDYSRNMLLAVSAGYLVPYEVLTGDLSNVNFSSGRMGWVEFKRSIDHYQTHIIIPRFCARVWDWFNQYAVIQGAANTPAGNIKWTPPRREMIDPTKELAAMEAAVRAGLMTWPEAVRANGFDPDIQIAEIAETNKKLDAAEVKLTSDPRYFPEAKGAMKDTDAEDGTDADGDTSNQTNKKKKATVKRPQGGGTQPS